MRIGIYGLVAIALWRLWTMVVAGFGPWDYPTHDVAYWATAIIVETAALAVALSHGRLARRALWLSALCLSLFVLMTPLLMGCRIGHRPLRPDPVIELMCFHGLAGLWLLGIAFATRLASAPPRPEIASATGRRARSRIARPA